MGDQGDWIAVSDAMQSGCRYRPAAAQGRDFAPDFAPFFSPARMLALGVFEGKYMNDCRAEFPAGWFAGVRLSSAPDPALNYFGVKSRQPLAEWRRKGWVVGPDPRG